MTTSINSGSSERSAVVEAYRLDRYDNFLRYGLCASWLIVEAYRLDRYDNSKWLFTCPHLTVVEAYRLDRYDNDL